MGERRGPKKCPDCGASPTSRWIDPGKCECGRTMNPSEYTNISFGDKRASNDRAFRTGWAVVKNGGEEEEFSPPLSESEDWQCENMVGQIYPGTRCSAKGKGIQMGPKGSPGENMCWDCFDEGWGEAAMWEAVAEEQHQDMRGDPYGGHTCQDGDSECDECLQEWRRRRYGQDIHNTDCACDACRGVEYRGSDY